MMIIVLQISQPEHRMDNRIQQIQNQEEIILYLIEK